MKKVFLFAVVLLCTGAVMAQNEAQTVILQNGDNVQVFNGIDAFKNAYNAATDGNTITLSEGTFNSPVNINKNVNIYGVGFEDIEAEGIRHSQINGDMNFYTGDDATSLQNIRIEGVYITGNLQIWQTTNMVVAKCSFGSFYVGGNNLQAVTIRQSWIRGHVYGSAVVMGLDFQNCYIQGKNNYSNADAMLLFNHCIIRTGADYANNKAIYTNCVFGDYYHANINTGSTVKHCICQFGQNAENINEGNWYNVNLNDVFTDGYPDYSASKTFTLADPTTYVGTDGTEVGINGGDFPWNKIPNTPVIKNLKVQVDGAKLNVTYDAQVR